MKLDVISGKMSNKSCFNKLIQVKSGLITLGFRTETQGVLHIKSRNSPAYALNYVHPTY